MPHELPLVLRLARSEKNADPEFILIHISQDDVRPLDLKLIGTDQSEVFAVSLKHNQTSSLKARNSKSSQDEWDAILSAILLGDLPDGADGAVHEGLEAVAEVDPGSSMTITLQKRIEGITQKFGQIVLPVSDDEIDLYEWCGLSIERRERTRQELETIKLTLRGKDEQIRHLDDSLAELIKLKNENEDQLLEKFALLLNEKKLKIRDQQRLLASSTVDPSKLEEIEHSRAGTRERSAGPSRARKRKAGTGHGDNDSESESNDGFEKMEVDDPQLKEAADENDNDASDKAGERTASETESDSDADAPAPTAPRAAPARNTRAASSQPSSSAAQLSQNRAEREKNKKKDEAPPKRELPFAKKPPARQAPAPARNGSETESDDEL